MNRPLASLPLHLAAVFALTAPSLLSYSLSPSSTLLNQLLAVFGWGAVLWLLDSGPRRSSLGALALPLGMLAILAAGVAVSWFGMLPDSMALSATLLLACAATVMLAAQADDGTVDGPLLWPVLAGVLLAGVLSGLIALIQVFLPSWTEGSGWIAKSGLVGRAVGNLRQPNHLSTLLLWGLIALVPQADAGRVLGWRLPGAAAAALGNLMVLAVVLTASRTGLVGVVLLALWGLLDRRLRKPVRWALVAAPVAYFLWWLFMAGWAHETAHTFGGEARLGESDLSASRFGIWGNTLKLIAANPWTGVGFGQFNFAWTLTPFPGRPVAFFDHTHNLLLQFAVELGIPAALLLTGLLVWTLVQCFQRCWSAPGAAGTGARAALVMVLLAGLHSMLEYPLWYAYFLLPTAWALGHALRQPTVPLPAAGDSEYFASPPATTPDSVQASTHAPSSLWAESRAFAAPAAPLSFARRWLLPMMGALMLAGALFGYWDYRRVSAIYAPGSSTLSLPERISIGQSSWLFSHHADYAAATTAEPPSSAMGAFAATTHSLLDTRLMLAWAKALNESGHVDKARYLAERLREFHNPASDDFFAVCNAPPAEGAALPFQCTAPGKALTWRDFKP
ncbi:Wzy polymerase domain-containing protein [Ideonella azotifigens]|nr:O-antigen ligase family protein [Ideonella azotifigens]MCD2339848.1 Wzy polymerase domain-containing protein [Ideonella azotifigens]